MNRRGFLSLFATGVAAAAGAHVLDPDQLLWIPGAKTFFLPSSQPILSGDETMALFDDVGFGYLNHQGNQLLTIDQITRECLDVLEKNLQFTAHLNRRYDDTFSISGAQIGTVINVRKPQRFMGRHGEILGDRLFPVTLITEPRT